MNNAEYLLRGLFDLEGRTRKHWWQPFTWDRHGVGMSVPQDADISATLNIKHKQLDEFSVHGVEERNGKFLPFLACFRFGDRYLVVDRAIHETGPQRMYRLEGKERKYLGTQYAFHYVTIHKEKPLITPENVPKWGRYHQESRTDYGILEQFRISGNNTLAVGFLPNTVKVITDKKYLRMGHICIPKDVVKKEICKTYNESVHVLGIEGGKLKKP